MAHRAPRIRVSGRLWHEDRLLLIRQGRPGSPRWMLPGGGVEGGEAMPDALTRELREEIGLRACMVRDPVAVVESIAPESSGSGRHLVHVVFGVDPGSTDPGTLEPHDPDIRELRWFRRNELLTVPIHPPIAAWLAAWRPATPFAYFGTLWAP
jgi:ADP-ribose pyrophosphatase YjhB (NUDIX family)